MTISAELSIYDYSDYRDFLKDSLNNLKLKNPRMSYANCARKLKSTKSFLQLLVLKKRHTTQDKIPLLGELFSLNKEEHRYLLFLFYENTSQDAETKVFFKQILKDLAFRKSFRDMHEERKSVYEGWVMEPSSTETFFVMSSWLHLAIYTLMKLPDFKPDPEWIQGKIGTADVESSKVLEILREFERRGLMIKEGTGYRQREYPHFENNLVNPENVAWSASFLAKALEMTNNIRKRPWMVQGGIFALDKESANHAIDLYLELYAKIVEMEKRCEKPDQVFLLANNFLTLTQ